MGKSNAKKQKHCGYIKPHTAHTYDREHQSPQPGATRSYERRLWCPGVATATAETAHKHVWESDQDMPVMRGEDGKPYILFSPYDENPTWEGTLSCSCGMSKWLKDGRYKPKKTARFPQVDPMDRIMALKEKLDAGGPDTLDDDDKAELQAIADALVAAFEPLVKAFSDLAKTVGSYIQAFLDQTDPKTIALMVEMTKAYSGETPDAVDTVTLYGDDGFIDEIVVSGGYSPRPAVGIVSDEEQAAYERGDEEHFRSLPDLPGIAICLEPGQVIVGEIIDLASLPVPRAQSFRNSSEH